jgi:DNA-binding transcriptional regulator YiaG
MANLKSARNSLSNPIPEPRNAVGKFFDIRRDEFLTAEQLAKILNVAPKTVRKWRFERKLPPGCMIKCGGAVRYQWGRVLEWIETQRS